MRKNGSKFWANEVITPILSEDGTLCGYTKIIRDISARLLAEDNAALLHAIFNAANHAFIATKPDGTINAFNSAAERLLGYRADEVVGDMTPATFHDSGEVAARAEALSREFNTTVAPGFEAIVFKADCLRSVDEKEWTFIRKDGSRLPVLLSVTAIRSENGTLLGYLGVATDITERKRADQQIRALTNQLQDAIESLNAGFVMYDADERLVVSNRKYRELYHLSADLMQPGRSYADIMRTAMLADPDHYRPLLGNTDLETWIARRLDDLRHSRPIPIQHLQNCWVQVDERRTSAGSYISLRTDITELKQMEVMSRQQSELMRLATTTAGIGMWIYDIATSRLKWDERMHEMYGYAVGETKGIYADWRDRLHPEDAERADAQLHDSMTHTTPFKTTFRLLLPDGTIRHIAASAGLSLNAEGQATSMVGVNLDITEQVTREDRLQRALIELKDSTDVAIQAREAAEAASRAKADFLATMSHEIRTPMNGVIGMTSLLLNTKLTGEQQDFIDSIRISGDALLAIINDILDFSKIEAGKLTIEPIRFDLCEATEDVIDLLHHKAVEKGVDLLLDFPADVNRQLIGDEGRIRQILLNLVGNALKFTQHGAVTVRVEERRRAGSTALIRITVSDTGIGMTPEQLSRMFQAFSQADASTTRRFGGTGLGLVICSRLCDLMHGSIAVTSEPGCGSHFIVELPLAVAVGPDHDAAVDALRTQPVVVLGDRPASSAVLGRILASWGMAMSIAADEEAAVRLLANASAIPLLVIDRTTVATSDDLLRRILARMPGRRILPVVIVAQGVRGDAERMQAAGFRAYLARPLRQATLCQALNTLLQHPEDGRLITRAALAEDLQAQTPREPRKALTPVQSRVLLAEDNSINQKVAISMLKRLGCLTDVAGNGIEAVELAARAAYDIILMDCQMPEMDGLVATRTIRQGSGPCRGVPIIALTANAMQGDRENCLAAGMSDYLSKPITQPALATMLAQWLAKQPKAAPEPARPSRLDELVNETGDLQTVIDVAQEFIDTIASERSHLETLVASSDVPRAREALHHLKGTAGSLGLVPLEKAVSEAENICRSGRLPTLGAVDREIQSALKQLDGWLATHR